METRDLSERTKKFSLRVLNLSEHLPENRSAKIIAGQILRSSTSVAPNYRASQRAKSTRDFVNKLKIVEEELDETIFWIEILCDSQIIPAAKIEDLKNEGTELLRIIVACIKTAKKRVNKGSSNNV